MKETQDKNTADGSPGEGNQKPIPSQQLFASGHGNGSQYSYGCFLPCIARFIYVQVCKNIMQKQKNQCPFDKWTIVAFQILANAAFDFDQIAVAKQITAYKKETRHVEHIDKPT